MQLRYRIIPSPIGDLVAWGDREAIAGLGFTDSRKAAAVETTWQRDDGAFDDVAQQLRAYFDGELKAFEVKLETRGTPFQRRVWDALRRIPRGETRTYSEIAQAIGAPAAVRAVGGACGANPVALVVPCHRAVRRDGGLGGYAWGLPLKKRLLEIEKRRRK